MRHLQDWRLIFVLFVAVACAAGFDKFRRSTPDQIPGSYNNFKIFRNSAAHLASGTDMYIPHPTEQHDLFLYTPTAAAAFTPLLHLPLLPGLLLWDALNAAALVGALAYLPRSRWMFAVVAWFVLKEAFTGFQHSQANGLTTALMVLTLGCLERKQPAAAALFTVMSLYLKLFGVASGALFLLYPQKLRFTAWGVLWLVVLGAVPLLITTPDSLAFQYANYLRMHSAIRQEFCGIGVLGMLHSWFGLNQGKGVVTLIGAAILLSPVLRRSQTEAAAFRQTFAGAIMLWVNLFNHKLEPATCIVGVTGAALCLTARPLTAGRCAVGAVLYAFTCWGNSDLVPQWVQDNVFEQLFTKTAPLLAVWLMASWELWTVNYHAEAESSGMPADERPALEESEEYLPLPLRGVA